MKRRDFLKLLPLSALGGCSYFRIDLMHVLVRSDRILSLEDEQAILAKAKTGWSADERVTVLYLQGSPYEIGYQHGRLLQKEVQENLGYLYQQALHTFHSAELFAEVYERMRPFIPQRYVDEMHGLAHGSRLPLDLIHAIHVLPSMSEWGGKKRIKNIVKSMMRGDLGTSCSNIGASESATADGQLLTVRVLDWGLHRISKLHEHPVIAVVRPDEGIPFANITWAGFLGCVSGMNAQGITIGEMGHGDPPHEHLRGTPMPFLLREVMRTCSSLHMVQQVLRESPGTNSFGFLMSDGKTGSSEFYIKDATGLQVFKPGQALADSEKSFPGLQDIAYAGHFDDRMNEMLQQYHGTLTPELLMNTIIPYIAMKSNFQNVIYRPGGLEFWVANAPDKSSRAAEAPYTYFDLGDALSSFPEDSSSSSS